MAKRRKKRSGKTSAPRPARKAPKPLPERAWNRLEEARTLMASKRWTEALDILWQLDNRYPNRIDILVELFSLYADLQDMPRYQAVAERLIKLTPNDPDVLLGLATKLPDQYAAGSGSAHLPALPAALARSQAGR